MKTALPKNDYQAYRRLLSPHFYGRSKTEIAAIIGVRKQAITRWKDVPLKYVKVISEATGIPKAHLRPSDFA